MREGVKGKAAQRRGGMRIKWDHQGKEEETGEEEVKRGEEVAGCNREKTLCPLN